METLTGAQFAEEARAARAALNTNPPSHEAMGWAARIWTRPENASRVMDQDLALSIAQALDEREGRSS